MRRSDFGHRYILSSWDGLFKCWLSRTSVSNVLLHMKHSNARPFHERSVAHVTAGTGGSYRPIGPREQAGRVADVVVCVGADYKTVELLAGHAGRTYTRLEVENERSVGDEGLVAAEAGAAHVSQSMHH